MSLESKVKKAEDVLVLPDVHNDPDINNKYYKSVKRWTKKWVNKKGKFDEIILLGDYMNCDSLSDWNTNKRKLMEGKRYQKEVEQIKKELDFLDKYTDKIVYIEGNHEYRVPRYIEKFPELQGLIEIPTVLELEERDIKWIKFNEFYKKGKMYYTHGQSTLKHHAHQHLYLNGCNIMYGHTHRPQTFMMAMVMQDPIMAYGLGCLCDSKPSYMHGKRANWLNQFAVVHYNRRGRFNVHTYNMIDAQVIGGV